MKIEPNEIVMLAKQFGLNVIRNGELLQVYPASLLTDDWLELLKFEKARLLAFLPDSQHDPEIRAMSAQNPPAGNVDLFGDTLANHWQGKHRLKKVSGSKASKQGIATACNGDLFDESMPNPPNENASKPMRQSTDTQAGRRQRYPHCETQEA